MAKHLETQFLTTQWTRILGGENSGSSDSASKALILLCENYHYPVFAFIRKRCANLEEAQDLTQGFFLALIEKNIHHKAKRERGRFRHFLLSAVKNFLANEHRNATTLKKGAGKFHFSVELGEPEWATSPELMTEEPPEALFDREWAVAVFNRVWKFLRTEYEELGQIERFLLLSETVTLPGESFDYSNAATQLGISENGAKSIAFRLRSRFRELFRATVAQLVDSPDEVDQEINHLIEAMAQNPH